jgi:two-component system OmpR family sensor kinase
MSRALAPIFAGLIGLAGSLGATLFLHRAASTALDRVLEERLRGAGEAAAGMLGRIEPSSAALRAVMTSSGLEGAYLLSQGLKVLADATGPAGHKADLLRVDAARAARAFRGEPSVDFVYAVGDLRIASGYFPVRGPDGGVRAVLALEAGQAFAGARAGLRHALWIGIAVSALGALTLALVARKWAVTEEQRSAAAAQAARGDALARMAAMVAHEIRNPIGIIRGAVDLVRERSGGVLGPKDREALADVVGEVERLRRLTQDFLDLSRDPALVLGPEDLGAIAAEAARGLARTYPDVAVRLGVGPLSVNADRGRLQQVLSNLLLNSAQAGARTVELRAEATGKMARLEVRDDGPGIDPAVRGRLFDVFATGRADGTGLGLALSRRIVERHGGALALVSNGAAGAVFELRLPLAPG